MRPYLLLFLPSVIFGGGLTVPKWSVAEVSLTAASEPANAYLDTHVTAQFTGPHGESKSVQGFWDGGKMFKLRYTPESEGRWTYRTSSNDPGLNGKTGYIDSTPATSGIHGFLRRDPQHPFHWAFDDGTHFFMLGQTYYELIGTARAKAEWRHAIDRSAATGFTKVRLRLFVKTCGNRENPIPCSSPYLSDKDHLDLEHWRAADETIQYLLRKGIVADLMPFNSGERYFGTPEQDARFLQYVVARYAAYPNVIWCVTNEYQRTGRSIEYMNVLGTKLRDSDPWIRAGESLRPLSIHPLGGKGKGDFFKFGDQKWPVHVILQTGRMDPADVPLNAEILRNRQFDMPVVDDEFGYYGDALWHNAAGDRGPNTNYYGREKHRNALWAIYMAGGYASAGDKFQYDDGKPYKTGLWHDAAENEDVSALAKLFTSPGLDWWRMEPDNQSVSGNRAYLLAERGKRYLVYCAAGGDVTIHLGEGSYRALLYDPKTGSEKKLGGASSGVATFTTPSGSDSVIYLSRLP